MDSLPKPNYQTETLGVSTSPKLPGIDTLGVSTSPKLPGTDINGVSTSPKLDVFLDYDQALAKFGLVNNDRKEYIDECHNSDKYYPEDLDNSLITFYDLATNNISQYWVNPNKLNRMSVTYYRYGRAWICEQEHVDEGYCDYHTVIDDKLYKSQDDMEESISYIILDVYRGVLDLDVTTLAELDQLLSSADQPPAES